MLAIDGKKERGTIPPGETHGEATIAVYDPERQEVLAQVVIQGEDEITSGQAALSQVALRGKIVLADALHTQRKLCQQVKQAQGDYVLIVKANQPALFQAIESRFTSPLAHPYLLDFQTIRKTNKGHGRIEERTLTAVSLLKGEIDWPHVNQVFRLENRFTFLRKGQVVQVEHTVRYGVTSLTRS